MGGDGGQVRDAEDLVRLSDALEATAHGVGCFASDVRVHLVEQEDGNGVLACEDGLEGEHDACELAAGGDGAEWAGRLTGVGGEEELTMIRAGWTGGGGRVVPCGWLERDVEACLLKA